MKKYVCGFVRRGLIAMGFGPIVLAVVYLILMHNSIIESIPVNEVCLGILSLSGLAFVVGGMNVIYQIEKMPLMVAISIHGSVLYIIYLITYLVNGWLKKGITPVLVFSGIFIFGYIIIWTVIYSVTKRSAAKINEKLKDREQVN